MNEETQEVEATIDWKKYAQEKDEEIIKLAFEINQLREQQRHQEINLRITAMDFAIKIKPSGTMNQSIGSLQKQNDYSVDQLLKDSDKIHAYLVKEK